MKPLDWSATVLLTRYDDNDEPRQDTISFGRYEDDDFELVEAGDQMGAEDEVREIMIAAELGNVDIDRIDVHPAWG